MNTVMFIVGFCIFSVYIFFTFWVMFDQNKKQREENYPNYYDRHGVDMDGHGNYGRFPGKPEKKVKAPKRKEGSQSRMKDYSRKFKQDV